jgi:hypothetical protein
VRAGGAQVPETLPAEVLEKMHAPPKPDVPIISAKDMPDADGFIFGIPTRYHTHQACRACNPLVGLCAVCAVCAKYMAVWTP